MKRCSKCNTDYFDNMLDFCLEDGAKLLAVANNDADRNKILLQQKPTIRTESKTVVLPINAFENDYGSVQTDTVETNVGQKQLQNQSEKIGKIGKTEQISEQIKDSIKTRWFNVLEIAPIVLAFAHNYWQWLYLSKQYYYGFAEYILSANFLIWFALLICGVIFGIISFKYGKNKKFAVTALIVLAINFLLVLIPK